MIYDRGDWTETICVWWASKCVRGIFRTTLTNMNSGRFFTQLSFGRSHGYFNSCIAFLALDHVMKYSRLICRRWKVPHKYDWPWSMPLTITTHKKWIISSWPVICFSLLCWSKRQNKINHQLKSVFASAKIQQQQKTLRDILGRANKLCAISICICVPTRITEFYCHILCEMATYYTIYIWCASINTDV